MKEQEFLICRHCGNIATKIIDRGPKLVCCGDEMIIMKANTQDAAQEKHVPVVKVDGNRLEVTVGSVEHPMSAEHHIAFIFVQTDKGHLIKMLPVNGKPEATFCLDGEKAVAVYEYCNLHGVWKLDL